MIVLAPVRLLMIGYKREGSSIGETRICPDTGEEFEVVWDGGPLLGPRPTRITDPAWTGPKRLYNKKANPDPNLEMQRRIERLRVPEVDEQATDLEADFKVEESSEN